MSGETKDGAATGKPAAPRDKIIDATMRLAAQRDFSDVTINDIAQEAGLSLADFRDLFPSKGAVLGGLMRRIDRKTLESLLPADDGSAQDRLYEVLRNRLEAMTPYRDALASVARWTYADPLMATALNREVVNSMRFMLEAADIDADGPLGALKLQGLALGWTRVLDAWFAHGDMSDALNELDRVLERGQSCVGYAENVVRATAPLLSLAHGLFNSVTGRRRASGDDEPHPHAGA